MNQNIQHTFIIYSPQQSERLTYVLHWIFNEQLKSRFVLTHQIESWRTSSAIKINYSKEKYQEAAIHIKPTTLLFETGIQPQSLSVNRWRHSTILFYNQPGAAVPFDFFAAVFFLLTRYEEYLPHQKDKHGRYAHVNSVAHEFSFLTQPVIDEWLQAFRKTLTKLNYFLAESNFQLQATYDIDIAWSYLHKEPKRLRGAALKDFIQMKWTRLFERKAVLKGNQKDPFDSYDFIEEITEKYNQNQPIFFFLLGKHSAFDKNIHPDNTALQQLIRNYYQKYKVGIHPSYLSNNDKTQLEDEVKTLARILGTSVTKSRQHYIKLSIPETYQNLISIGITDDYSMGYPSANGFRAGTSQSFLWYDLSQEKVTGLRVHPFAFMEETSRVYQQQTAKSTWAEWERIYYAVKSTGGTLISIWHNHSLGTDTVYKGWRELYQKIWEMHAIH